jgi:hypothetical protein
MCWQSAGWARAPSHHYCLRSGVNVVSGRRWAVTAAMLVALFTAACGGSVTKKTVPPPASPSTSSAIPRTTTPPTTTPPVTSPTTALPATTVPQGFRVASVTFVSAQLGWVLGSTCAGPSCAAVLYRTEDGGHGWAPINTPPLTDADVGDGGDGEEIRFANAEDGWIVARSQTAPYFVLWATYDAGAHWALVQLPAGVSGDSLSDLETAAGTVYASFCGYPIHIAMSPVTSSDWTLSATTLATGAGPVCDEPIVLQGAVGWLINVDRLVINGARLDHDSWATWNPPCTESGGSGEVAAANADDLVAVCDGGIYSGPADVSISFSTDGGTTFVAAPVALPPDTYGPIASPTPGVVVMSPAGEGTLMATFDSGRQWAVVYGAPASGGWQYVGFTTAEQGVAIGQSGTLVMTYDGGHEWTPVQFPSH